MSTREITNKLEVSSGRPKITLDDGSAFALSLDEASLEHVQAWPQDTLTHRYIFSDIVTLSTDVAQTRIGLTPGGVVKGAALLVSTAIAGLDSADHHIQLGTESCPDKYIDKANGSAATSIAKNTKAHWVGSEIEEDELLLTITGGSDNVPSAGAVTVEVYFETLDDVDEV